MEFTEENTWEIIEMSEACANGIQPYKGGYMDQPRVLMAAIRYVWILERPFKQRSLGPLAALSGLLR